MLGLLGVGVPWQPRVGRVKGDALLLLGAHFITRLFEPQVIALGICELLWSYDASNPWLRTVGHWTETDSREWELSVGLGVGVWQNWREGG